MIFICTLLPLHPERAKDLAHWEANMLSVSCKTLQVKQLKKINITVIYVKSSFLISIPHLFHVKKWHSVEMFHFIFSKK